MILNIDGITYTFPKLINDKLYYPFTMRENKVDILKLIHKSETEIILKSDQLRVLKELIKNFIKYGTSILLNLHTGYGKTYTTLFFLNLFRGIKILIIVPRKFLKDYWISKLIHFQNIKNIDIELPITFSNNLKDNIHYDIVIVDECHMNINLIYNDILLRMSYNILIGLSATPKYYELINLFYYTEIVRKKTTELSVIKIRINYKPHITYSWKYINNRRLYTIDYSKMNKSLNNNNDRTTHIASWIIEINEKYNEKSIVLTKNKIIVEKLYDILKDKFNICLVYDSKEPNISNECNMIIGTYSQMGTGYDTNKDFKLIFLLDNLIDIRQAEGRIRSEIVIAIDFVDNHYIYENHWKLREDWYIKRHANIIEY